MPIFDFKQNLWKKCCLYYFYRNKAGLVVEADAVMFETIDELLTCLREKVCDKSDWNYSTAIRDLYNTGKLRNTNDDGSIIYEISSYTYQKLHDFFNDTRNISKLYK